MAEILLGVTGSIAAYKAADLASRLKKRGHQVHVIMTASAERLVGPSTFHNLTGNRVFKHDPFDDENGQTEHIALTDRADLVVVAPATANFIAKMALGIADDMLGTTLLAVRSPVLVCPAMNTRMWNHPSVRKNLALVREQGAHVLEPDAGSLACGHVGPGRLAEPAAIEAEVERLLASGKPAPVAFFLERITLVEEPSSELLAQEQTYRRGLVQEGALLGGGPVAPRDGREWLHVHRAASVAEARARAQASPFAKRGAKVELVEWHAGAI
ncbi:MAG TPA: flavoprotein [Planctomycetota bacterium]|nr:flavoprotein [Planctomycetota bacterium]